MGGIAIRRLKIIENNFTKNYRLNKKKSNQLLLTTKIVLFASCFTLINPSEVTASSNTIIENQDSGKINDGKNSYEGGINESIFRGKIAQWGVTFDDVNMKKVKPWEEIL